MLYVFLILIFIQLNAFTSEQSSSSSSSSSQIVRSINNNRVQPNKLIQYLKKTTNYLNNLSNTKKAFLGLLGIALIVYKHDKIMAWLIAIKHYLALRKLEYCVITVMGLKLTNFVIYNKPSCCNSNDAHDNIDPNLLHLPGETYSLNLQDGEYYSCRPFCKLIDEQHKAGLSFILAKARFNNSSTQLKDVKHFICDCNATDFHRRLFMNYKKDNVYLSLNFIIPFQATFIDSRSLPFLLEQVHYFEISHAKSEYLGSNYDLDKINDKQKEMSWRFIKAMNSQEVANWLLNIENYYDPSQKNVKVYDVTFDYLDYFAKQKEHTVFAKYLMALLYVKKQDFAKANQVLNQPEMQNISLGLKAKVSQLLEEIKCFGNKVLNTTSEYLEKIDQYT